MKPKANRSSSRQGRGELIVSDRAAKPKRGDDSSPFDIMGNEIAGLKKVTKREATISEADKAKLSKFRETYSKLKDQLGPESEDPRSELTVKAMYRAFLVSAMEMLSIAEEQVYVKKSESSIYAFNALINQIKETSAELRRMDDLDEQAEYISMRIVAPMLIQFTQNLLQLSLGVKAAVDTQGIPAAKAISIKNQIDNMLRSMASYMQEHGQNTDQRIRSYLVDGAK